jgi:hypothetical protein
MTGARIGLEAKGDVRMIQVGQFGNKRLCPAVGTGAIHQIPQL